MRGVSVGRGCPQRLGDVGSFEARHHDTAEFVRRLTSTSVGVATPVTETRAGAADKRQSARPTRASLEQSMGLGQHVGSPRQFAAASARCPTRYAPPRHCGGRPGCPRPGSASQRPSPRHRPARRRRRPSYSGACWSSPRAVNGTPASAGATASRGLGSFAELLSSRIGCAAPHRGARQHGKVAAAGPSSTRTSFAEAIGGSWPAPQLAAPGRPPRRHPPHAIRATTTPRRSAGLPSTRVGIPTPVTEPPTSAAARRRRSRREVTRLPSLRPQA